MQDFYLTLHKFFYIDYLSSHIKIIKSIIE